MENIANREIYLFISHFKAQKGLIIAIGINYIKGLSSMKTIAFHPRDYAYGISRRVKYPNGKRCKSCYLLLFLLRFCQKTFIRKRLSRTFEQK